MAKTNEPPKSETTDTAAVSLPQTSPDASELETLKRLYEAQLDTNDRLAKELRNIEQAARDLAPGDVLSEDEKFETVVVRRPKAHKPTGRYRALHFYRVGNGVEGASDGMLHPGKVYALPDAVIEHGLKHGAIEPELA